ncbi:hypothetical protein C1645_811833 [Glomus cerebriforme]|uniref:Uncharacterized protein n=1 Tax=Glomus cerebriforme TaxID=658196 RepID=A0A397TRK0_9GLOM|nr:hypothetical protein C1645_811833 [Glomus cerebriforme]
MEMTIYTFDNNGIPTDPQILAVYNGLSRVQRAGYATITTDQERSVFLKAIAEEKKKLLEQLGWKNMSREKRLLAFIHEVSTEVMEIDSNSSEVQRYLPAGTSLDVAKDKIKKTKKMVKIFSDDPSRIQFIHSFSVDQLSTFNEDDINFIKLKLPKPEMP